MLSFAISRVYYYAILFPPIIPTFYLSFTNKISLRGINFRTSVDAATTVEPFIPLPPKEGVTQKWSERDSEGHFLIPYRISGRFLQDELATIQQGMTTIEKNTCIRFVRSHHHHRRSSSESRWWGFDSHVEIRNVKGEGCRSLVGAPSPHQSASKRFSSSFMYLESPSKEGCTTLAKVLHELLHVVGLNHEHQRFGAQEHVTVHYENIEPKNFEFFREEGFDESDEALRRIPYDYLSIMHYGKSDYASPPWAISLEARDSLYQELIGTTLTPTPNDYAKVCALYGCEECLRRHGFAMRGDGIGSNLYNEPPLQSVWEGGVDESTKVAPEIMATDAPQAAVVVVSAEKCAFCDLATVESAQTSTAPPPPITTTDNEIEKLALFDMAAKIRR